MYRNIYVGENYSRKVTTPLITTDCNSYKIVWDAKATKGTFKVTAIRDDDSAVFDFGELTDDGVATYVMKNDMYAKEGNLTLYLAICDDMTVITCREIIFVVKKGAEEEKTAQENTNPINSLAMQISKYKTDVDAQISNLQQTGMSDVYILKEGEDIVVTDGAVTKFLINDYSSYQAIAFPEGITQIMLPDENRGGDTPLVANKVIMPKSLETIGKYSFGNYVSWNEDDSVDDRSVVVKVNEFVLNEGLKVIDNYAFSGNIYLEKINIPNSVYKIGRGAFEYCDGLKEVYVPSALAEIGNGNFTSSTFKAEDATVIKGYAGSEAENYAKSTNGLKEYENTFVNIGSDYSKEIGDIDKALDSIIAIQTEMLGGDNK